MQVGKEEKVQEGHPRLQQEDQHGQESQSPPHRSWQVPGCSKAQLRPDSILPGQPGQKVLCAP